MKIQITNSEAEIDTDLLAEELSSSIESTVDSYVSDAVDNLDVSYQVEETVRDHDFDYDIERALDAYCFGNVPEIGDLGSRVEKLEQCIERMTLAMPSAALDAVTLERDQWIAKFEQLETKFKALVGLDQDTDLKNAAESEDSDG
tara:strand:- start:520 stop:954 length:435 start_codon:yes stop_codon:yes gene_type:complete